MRRNPQTNSRQLSDGFAHRRGLTLLETAVSTLIVGILLIAALRAVGTSVMTGAAIERQQRGMLLADHLLSEVLRKDYREPGTSSGTIGLESPESASAKATFDDIDDYQGWSESPPQRSDGSAITAMSGWSRVVAIENVNPDDTASVISNSDDRGVRRIRVTVLWNGNVVAECQSLESDSMRHMNRDIYQPFISQP